jgi:hypothetical protein
MKRTLLILVLAVGGCILLAASPGAVSRPGTVVLDGISDIYGPVTFDHESHTMYAESCGRCHHQHPIVDTISCKLCHSVEALKDSVISTFLPCKSCHGTYDPAQPGMPGLKVAYHRTCLDCHEGMGNVGETPQGCTEQCHARVKQ